MMKTYSITLLLIIICSLSASAQAKLDGAYRGMQEMAWTDSSGAKHNYFGSPDSVKWYHENLLIIKGDSVHIDQCPVNVVNGKKLYSASTGGFYTYAGVIVKKDSTMIANISLRNCDYCPQEAVMENDSTGEHIDLIDEERKVIYTYVLTKTKKGITLNAVDYKRLSTREIKRERF